MFRVRRVETGDIDTAISVLGDAFAQDPLMLYLFHESPHGARAGAMGFFSILLRARIALEMPAYVLEQGDEILGAVMGYDASRPEWPAPLADELRRYEADTPGFAARLDAYGKLADAHQRRSLLSWRDRCSSVTSRQGCREDLAWRLLRPLPHGPQLARRLSRDSQHSQPAVLLQEWF
jgi:hypothetical protein